MRLAFLCPPKGEGGLADYQSAVQRGGASESESLAVGELTEAKGELCESGHLLVAPRAGGRVPEDKRAGWSGYSSVGLSHRPWDPLGALKPLQPDPTSQTPGT